MKINPVGSYERKPASGFELKTGVKWATGVACAALLAGTLSGCAIVEEALRPFQPKPPPAEYLMGMVSPITEPPQTTEAPPGTPATPAPSPTMEVLDGDIVCPEPTPDMEVLDGDIICPDPTPDMEVLDGYVPAPDMVPIPIEE